MADPTLMDRDGDVLVLGLGRSGLAAARLLLRQGRSVTVIDAGATPYLAEQADTLRASGARVLTGCAATPPADPFAFAVVSPGVALDAPWMRHLAGRGIPRISELELGWRSLRSRILAITGSNGKSTLATVCAAALAAAGCSVRIGANFGDPLSLLALDEPASDWVVAEVSSFQMETSPQFQPRVGVWLNLYPNHLDRHGTMECYARLKARLLLNMDAGGQAVVFEGADALCPALHALRCPVIRFGTSPAADVRYHSGAVIEQRRAAAAPISVADTPFDDPVLGPTAAAAVAALRACGIDPAVVTGVARSFQPLPHRLQTVAVIDGIRFFDDSKSTNLAALTAALERVPGPIRLLAGGRLQEKELESIKEHLRNRVVAVYLWGTAAGTLAAAWAPVVSCRVFDGLPAAVAAAWREAQRGDAVVLSPGCSSRDQFNNFAERGQTFLAAVRRIKQGDRS